MLPFYVQTGWPWWTRSVPVGTRASWRGLPQSGEWCFVRLWLLLSILHFQRTAAPLHTEARTRCISHWIYIIYIHPTPLFPHSLSIRQTKTNGFRGRCLHIAYMSKSTLGVLLVCGWIMWAPSRFLMCSFAERATCTPRREFEWMRRAHCEWGNIFRIELVYSGSHRRVSYIWYPTHKMPLVEFMTAHTTVHIGPIERMPL
jgi:hypothetical protein